MTRTRGRQRGDRIGDPPHDDDSDAEPDPERVARTIALNRLAVAPQTRAQLDDAMRRRGVSDEIRDRVLDRFGAVGLIDDAMFAQAWVESRHAGRGLAKKALAFELRRRGVEPAVVNEAVGALGPDQEEATARELVRTRLGATAGLDPAVRTRRLAGMLARKGYPAGLAYRVVRDAVAIEGVTEEHLPEEPTGD
ncbi:MAG: regulatory protein RecX [Jiangellaceae bacterium]